MLTLPTPAARGLGLLYGPVSEVEFVSKLPVTGMYNASADIVHAQWFYDYLKADYPLHCLCHLLQDGVDISTNDFRITPIFNQQSYGAAASKAALQWLLVTPTARSKISRADRTTKAIAVSVFGRVGKCPRGVKAWIKITRPKASS